MNSIFSFSPVLLPLTQNAVTGPKTCPRMSTSLADAGETDPPPSSGPANTCYELPAAARRWRYGAGAQGRTDPKFERVFLFVCLFDAWAGVDWKDGKPTYLPLFYEFYAWKEGVLPPYPGSVFQDALCLQIVEFSPPKNVRCSQWTLGG